MKPRVQDLYYFAGFFDGEGAIMLSYNKYVRLEVAVSQNTRDVPDWYSRVFGGHVYAYVPKGRSDTTIFQWKVHGDEATEFLKKVIPMLIVKKVQAMDAKVVWENRHSLDVALPIIYKWKEFHRERRKRIADAKAKAV